ncbi:MAG: SCO family protein [Myxococcales bacterium]|nr:SCO family protein [Myxococcales bacterium]
MSLRSSSLGRAFALGAALVAGLLLGAPAMGVGGEARADTTAKPTPDTIPAPLVGIEIEDHAGADLPRDITIRTQEGRDVKLGSYLGDGKPLIVVLAYYECPMLCTVVLNGLQQGLSGLAWTAGKEFRVLTVSFDPRDTTNFADRKRRAYLQAYGREVAGNGWDFATAAPREIERLTKMLGFKYRWDESTSQYAHSTGAFLFTPEGKLSVTMHGVAFPARDLRLALNQAADGKLGTTWDRVMLLCYHYDPNARSYVLAGTRLMRAGGVVTLLIMSFFLRRMWRRERRRALEEKDESPSGAQIPAPTPSPEITP